MSISNNIFRGSRKPTKKCAMKIKQRKKKKTTGAYPRVIIILKEVVCMGATQKDRKGFEGSSDQLFLTH